MAKPVELQVTDAVPLQEVVKLLWGCLRIHHVAVLLGEHVVEIPPSIAEVVDMAILLQTVLGQRFAEPFGNRDGADTALGLWLLLTSLTIAELINTALDRYALVLKINVRPFEPYDLTAPTTCEQGNFYHRPDMPRLAFQGFKNVTDLLERERLDPRFRSLAQRQRRRLQVHG